MNTEFFHTNFHELSEDSLLKSIFKILCQNKSFDFIFHEFLKYPPIAILTKQ